MRIGADWVATLIAAANLAVAIATLVATIRGNRKTAPRKPSKRKRKR